MQLQQGDSKAALAAYKEFLKISQKLAAADPASAQAQRDLSVSYDRIGNVHLQHGDTTAALTAYQEILKISQKIAAANPASAQAQRDLSISYERLGNVQLQHGDTKAALDWYVKMYDIKKRLVSADPGSAVAHRDLLISMLNIGKVAEQKTEFEKAIEWYQKALDVPKNIPRPEYLANEKRVLEGRLRICRGAEMVLADLDAIEKVAYADRADVLRAAIQAHVRRKAPDKAIAAANLLERAAKNGGDVYDAACGYALCSALVEKPEENERHAARAVALLKQAIAKGYKDVAHLKKDADLDALRGRADFQALLKELEAKQPEKP